MSKSHIAACLAVAALAAAPAFAQTAPAPSGATDRPAATGSGSATSGSSAMQPSVGATVGTSPASPGAPSTMSQSGADTSGTAAGGTSSGMPSLSGTASPPTAGPGGAAGGQIVAQQQAGQWLASKLIGTTVVGADNQPIGDVNDVLLERSGQAVAVIIGVGGFLGIGEKDVAVSFSQLEFTGRAAGSASGPATTGTTATTGSGTGAAAPVGGAGTAERIMVRMTKQDLQNAPRFARADQPREAGATGAASGPRPVSGGDRGTTGTAPASPGGTNQAPKQ